VPLLGDAPYTHTDLGQQRACDPVGFSSSTTPPSQLHHVAYDDLAAVWSYTVPADVKTTVAAINVGAYLGTIATNTNFQHVRDGRVERGAIVTLSVDGNAVLEMEARMVGMIEEGPIATTAKQYAPARDDGACPLKFDFGDGLQLTAGQDLAAAAAVVNPSGTLPGIFPQVHHLRLWGKRTDTGAPLHYDAVCRPSADGIVAFTWSGQAQQEVGAGGFTVLGASLRSECVDNVVSWYNVLMLNEQPLAFVGHFTSSGGSNIEPQHIPLWGLELYPGDRLELRAMLGPDIGQVINVAMAAVEESMAGGAAPTIALVSPAEGAIAADDALVIDVTADDTLALVTLHVALGDSPVAVPVYLSGAWQAGFTASSAAAITGGLRFTIRRSGGWPAGAVQTSAHAVAGGELASDAWAWAVAGEAELPALPLPVVHDELAEVDHTAAALARLPQQYRGDL
jgi:hypothetical protein